MKASLFRFFITLLLLQSCSAPLTNRELAEKYVEEEKFKKAIEAYNAHMNSRLQDYKRPSWENPYFYYLLIGDMYLKLHQIDRALEYYLLADTENVEPESISDRYRYVATYYEQKGDLKKAITILKKYRDRDELLFDLMIDRIARKMIGDQPN